MASNLALVGDFHRSRGKGNRSSRSHLGVRHSIANLKRTGGIGKTPNEIAINRVGMLMERQHVPAAEIRAAQNGIQGHSTAVEEDDLTTTFGRIKEVLIKMRTPTTLIGSGLALHPPRSNTR